jgi:hypothetical protein
MCVGRMLRSKAIPDERLRQDLLGECIDELPEADRWCRRIPSTPALPKKSRAAVVDCRHLGLYFDVELFDIKHD